MACVQKAAAAGFSAQPSDPCTLLLAIQLRTALPARRSQSLAMEEGAFGRVIVFTNFREGVTCICDALAEHEPLITARPFIGQGGGGSSKQGPGMKQAEQKAVLNGFRWDSAWALVTGGTEPGGAGGGRV